MQPYCEGLDANGCPVIRRAKIIDDLLTPAERLAACASATVIIEQILGMTASRPFPFGAPVYMSFMTRPKAKRHHHRELLLTRGCDVSLYYCPEYNSSSDMATCDA